MDCLDDGLDDSYFYQIINGSDSISISDPHHFVEAALQSSVHPLVQEDTEICHDTDASYIDAKLQAIDEIVSHVDKQCCSETCSEQFETPHLKSVCLSVLSLPREQAQAFICGLISAVNIIGVRSLRNRSSSRKKYTFFDKPFCRTMLCIALGISKTPLQRLAGLGDEMYSGEELSFSEKRGGCPRSRKIPPEASSRVVQFIDEISETYGLPDPGRSRRDSFYGRLISLPHKMSKEKLYELYENTIGEDTSQTVLFFTIWNDCRPYVKRFFTIWNDCRPYVKRFSLRSDMCALCAQFQNLLGQQLVSHSDHAPCRIDATVKMFNDHRERDHASRIFYKECQKLGQSAFNSKWSENGVDYLDLLVVRMDFGENTEYPSHTDQEGEMYFLSPVKVGLFGVTDEGSRQHMTFILPERRTIKKNASAVRSMLLQFLRRRNANFKKLHMFADNASGQNKNRYIFALLSMIVVKRMFDCEEARISFMTVGHTKFAPDGWFGHLKRRLLHIDVDTLLDIEEAVYSTGKREHARALGEEGQAHTAQFTHCQFANEPLFRTVDLHHLSNEYFKELHGHSIWFDIKIKGNGQIQWRAAPCGDYDEDGGKFWNTVQFGNNIRGLREINLRDLPQAEEVLMDEERVAYIFEKNQTFCWSRYEAVFPP